MKLITLILAALALLIPSCATKSDPTFMNNAAAAINGGMIATPMGAQFSPGIQTPAVHPFFGAP